MTTTTTTGSSKTVRVLGLLTIIFGIIFIIAGGVTWGAVASNLAAEQITVSDDAQAFGGQLVDTPWEAWFQADIINTHALEASGGKTYAELDQDDPTRQTVMTASFLRASLFTSVVAFGVALLVVGIGVVFILIGWALRKAAVTDGVVASSATSTGSAAYPDPVPAGRPTAPPAPTSSTTPPPAPTTSRATPNATTDVNNDARRNDAVMTVWRVGSSWSSSA